MYAIKRYHRNTLRAVFPTNHIPFTPLDVIALLGRVSTYLGSRRWLLNKCRVIMYRFAAVVRARSYVNRRDNATTWCKALMPVVRLYAYFYEPLVQKQVTYRYIIEALESVLQELHTLHLRLP